MNKKTIAIFAVCMVLVAALSVFTTLALLTDTKTVTNTFTSGNVSITLDEGEVWEQGDTLVEGAKYGKFTDAGVTRVTENEYRVYPGVEYDKDPTITINTGSEDAYVGATLAITNADKLAAAGVSIDQALTTLGINKNDGWAQIKSEEKSIAIPGDTEGSTVNVIAYVYTFTYANKLSVAGNATLFDTFELDVEADNAVVAATAGMKIIVNGYAVQAEGQTTSGAALAIGFPDVFPAA